MLNVELEKPISKREKMSTMLYVECWMKNVECRVLR